MAKQKADSEEKADSDKQGWFARWRGRRKQSRLRAGLRQRQLYDDRSKGEQFAGRHGPYPGPNIPGAF
jgi:hypothetical protein